MTSTDSTQANETPLAAAIGRWRAQLRTEVPEPDAVRPLELSAAHPVGLSQLLSGRMTRLSSLVREPSALAHSRNRVYELQRAIKAMIARHGVAPVYFGIGQASWSEAETGQTVEGPAFLIPIQLSTAADGEVTLRLGQAVELWAPLRRELAKNIDVAPLLEQVRSGSGYHTSQAIAALREQAEGHLVGFDIYETLTVGQYLHPMDLLADDLDALEQRLHESDLIAALAGDEGARERIDRKLPQPNPADRSVESEGGLGDLDPIQHDIREAVSGGYNLVINAGPDCDLLETVTAVAVDGAANGRTVAFISADKNLTATFVAGLEGQGLGDMVMDLTEPANWSGAVTGALKRACVITEHVDEPAENHEVRAELDRVRQELGNYTEQLHHKRSPWGISAYDALQVLADLSGPDGPRTRVRFGEDTLSAIATDGAQAVRELLHAAHDAGILTGTRAENAWHGAVISGPEVIEPVLETVRRVAHTTLPQVRAQISRVARETGLVQARNLRDWVAQLQLLEGVREALDVFQPLVFERSVEDMIIATAPRAWRRENAYNMKRSVRRRLVKQAKDMVRPSRGVDDLHAQLQAVSSLAKRWTAASEGGGRPVLPTGLDQMRTLATDLGNDLEVLQPFLATAHGDLRDLGVDRLATLTDKLAADEAGARALPQRVALLRKLHDAGVSDLVEDLRERAVSQAMIDAELDLAWWASALTVILGDQPQLRELDAQQLVGLTRQIRHLDAAQVRMLADRAGSAYSQQTNELIEANIDQASQLLGYLGTDTEKSLRSIVDNFPIAAHLAPIRVSAAAVVPQLFAPRACLDVAIIDITGYATVAELIPILARARTVVIVGDQGRAPLLNTFTGMLPAVELPLKRPRNNEQVNRFLAEHGCDTGRLAVIAPRATTSVTLHIVDGRGTPTPGETAIESSAQEVSHVVALIQEHARTLPHQSLAVVALNARHALRLREAIFATALHDDELDAYIQSMQAEPFTVVDPERAPSIRRDRIIISVGFAKTPHGRVIHDFGAISQPNGARIITDALTTVRGDLVIVTALDPAEIDQERLTGVGARTLCDMLNMAGRGESAFTIMDAIYSQSEEEAEPDRLLVDLAERLYSLGLTVLPNVGPGAGMRIPLAIGHPALPDELLVAVLTDNASFAAEPSLRRRYRHQLERLEASGWVPHMVYSASVFIDPQGEAQKIVERVLDIVEDRLPHLREEAISAAAEAAADGAAVDGVGPEAGADATDGDSEVAAPHGEPAVELDAAANAAAGGEPAVAAGGAAGPEPNVEQDSAPSVADEAVVDGRPAAGGGEPEADTHVNPALVGTPLTPLLREHDRGDQFGVDELFTGFVSGPRQEPEGYGLDALIPARDITTATPSAPPASGVAPVARRGPKPAIAVGMPLAAYGDDQLDEMLAWVKSDGSEHSSEELVELLRQALGITRRGAQIDAVLSNVVRRNDSEQA